MGINRGPNLRRENLLYGIDNGYGIASNDVSTRFAQGKPTANLAPPSLADWGTENTAERISSGNFYKGQPTYNCRTTVGASYQGIDKTITGLRTAAGSSGTVTMSCWVRNNFSVNVSFYAYIGHDFSSTRTIALNSDWQRIQWVVNQSAMNNDYVELRPYTNDANTYIEMTMPQVEVNVGTATPWTATSRSTTESLIDLKRTRNISTANVSFDSDGIVAFDGTNDIVNTGMFVGRNPHTDPFTIEAIVKSDTTSGSHMWLDATNNGTNQRLYCAHAATGTGNPMGIQGTAWDSSGVSDTDFHHYVIVMDGSVARLYNNSVQHSTRNYTSYVLQQINFGGRGGYYWNGLIPVFKIHNEALSVKQIEENFNVYKNRFNI
jgi:hypothetical protein